MQEKSELYAAVDLGSNSFHMIIAEMVNNQLHIIDRHKDMVRLANGLDSFGNLTLEKILLAIASLEKIGQRIKHIPKSHLRVVGTNTLRKAKNSQEFRAKAAIALGVPIDIISGREEARILYLGVSHSLPKDQGQRLVIDIGGGSTELIIGEEFVPSMRESLHMGCVSYTKRFFSDGKITQSNWNSAVLSARRQLLPLVSKYQSKGWEIAVGASGTMRAVTHVIIENEYSVYGIDINGLNHVREKCLALASIQSLNQLNGLSIRREPVFIGGLAIIQGLFDSLGLHHIESCSGALREGIIYDLSGRLSHNDVRQRTTDKLCQQFEIDTTQSSRVKNSINAIINVSQLNLTPSQLDLINWSAQLHELGLNISHSHFEKHAAYVLIHADMPGFSIQEQLKLAVLVALQRRKIKKDWLKRLSTHQYQKLLPLIVILRLAVIINRPRIDSSNEIDALIIGKDQITLTVIKSWIELNPLTHADLQSEVKYLNSIGINYQIILH